MNEQEALLASIFDQPEDDTLRLIYADWLDERGESNYAEFIRAQIAYARSEPLTEENVRLWHEILKFWSRLRQDWPLVFQSIPLLDPQHFRRGFYEEMLEVDASTFATHGSEWSARLLLRRLSLRVSLLTISDVVRMPELTRLTELTLIGHDLYGDLMPNIANCRHLRGLKVLDLSEFQMGIESIEALVRATTLDSLEDLRLPMFMRPNREGGRLLRRRFGDVCRF